MNSKKSVVISGVSGGIGKSLAKNFHEAGYFVVGIDEVIVEDPFVDTFLEIDLDSYCIDQSYRNKMDNLLLPLMSSTSVLINNAAVQLLDHIEDLNLDDWQKSLNVNLTAAMLLSKLLDKTLSNNKGNIINIGSIHQDQTKASFISYATSKSALIGLTKALAVDFNGRVRVNAISPAAIDTDMLRAGFNHDESKIEALNAIHPSGRIGKTEEVAQLALFIASEKADFINGANIALDGGISSVLKDLD